MAKYSPPSTQSFGFSCHRAVASIRRVDSERCGFTLVELVMVIAIVGIMAAIAAPRYANSVARYRADMAARRIAADLAFAQSRARVVSASRTVTFNVGASSYQLAGIADFKNPANTYGVNLTASPYEAAISSASLGGDATIVFNGWGLPDSGGTVVVRSGSVQKTITVDAVTGGATIQ